MISLTALWLPILLSAVIVFVVSSIIHMALSFWHKNDCLKVPNEDKMMDALRPLAIPPGDYMVPRCDSMADMKSPAFAEKMKKGPVIVFTVLPNGPVTMGKSLVLWFLYSIVISIFAGYVGSRALHVGSHYLEVFRFVGTAAFLGYTGALAQFSIWYGRNWVTTVKGIIDGLIYALMTAGTFGWLWPR